MCINGYLIAVASAFHCTGFILSAVVTLSSIEIFKTHEWLKVTPTVYFLCKADNKTVLPDVKKAHVSYTFKTEESWQVYFYIFTLFLFGV